jgi:hypothetical protein
MPPPIGIAGAPGRSRRSGEKLVRRRGGGGSPSDGHSRVQPQGRRLRLVEVTLRVVGAEHVLELARRAREALGPGCHSTEPASSTGRRRAARLQGLLGPEDPDLGALDEARVVVVHPELHRLIHHHGDGMRRDAEPRTRLEIVEAELDLGVVEGDVGAALDVGRVRARVVDRLPSTVMRMTLSS